MEENRIKLHQAYYGEVEKAHSCIAQSIKDTDLTSFLIAFTDRPAALPPGVELFPYLSGVAFSKYYIFTKTFPDSVASRAGMVFTHALILDLNDISKVTQLEDILNCFVNEVPIDRTSINTIEINISDLLQINNSKKHPEFIKHTISALLKGVSPILFSGKNDTFKVILQLLWNLHDINLRTKLKFRASFSPSDIDGFSDLTIVSIQKELINKWSSYEIINSENNNEVEINSYTERLLLGEKEANPFHSFLIELNINQSELSNYGKTNKLYNDFLKLDLIDNADTIRQDIRFLGKLSASHKDGKEIKDKFIHKLEKLIEEGKDANLRAIRNIDWSAFDKGEEKANKILSNFIYSEFAKNEQFNTELILDLFEISINDEQKNWWHNTVKESISILLSKENKQAYSNLWKCIDSSKSNIDIFKSVFSISKDTENSLRESIPSQLKIETINKIESFSKQSGWFLLHAEIILKYLTPEEAIIKQLVIENSITIEKSNGFKFIAEKIPDEKIIEITLKTFDRKLIQISVDRILKNRILLHSMKLSESCWFDIWVQTLDKTRNVTYGIEGREYDIMFSIFDMVIAGNTGAKNVIDMFASSSFTDIVDYYQREKIWAYIPSQCINKFLINTTKSVFRKFLIDEIKITSIEKQLVNIITSDEFMTSFLHDNKDDIDKIIKVFDSFQNLKDDFLSDYISYYSKSISEIQSRNLGKVVISNSFKKSAKSIYNKSRINSSFEIAYEQCKELYNWNWLDFFSYGSPSNHVQKRIIPISDGESSKTKEMENTLPTVLILTAIKEEYLAVRSQLKKEIKEIIEQGTCYEQGLFEFKGSSIANVIIHECGPMNTTSSQEAQRAISAFNPSMMMFVGIAGSRKPNDFKLGDVIFPSEIYYYEGAKATKDTYKARPKSVSPTFELSEIAKKERLKNDWKTLLNGDYNASIKAEIGIIASGEQLIDHHDSEIGRILDEHYNDSHAVEMEGYGFVKAVTRQGGQSKNITVGVVRGISDIIEKSVTNNQENGNERRPENARQIASETAAAFAFWLILKTFT